ncbi:aldose epimerase family protein [Paenibacillus roseipurpureus]|uniref:DUF5107 domain-containing protein n=1 Tax=Paenibacillus roseopurpureus TaxID=2918901 RepID=A0AA96LKR7_9BACL|nr:hypothetical protein [Paenibacillus sp. MBLB1832]WNR42848.1 hypothetical protein MJB10_17195 [Paenibacillus sp. MBLB1832]
MSDGTWQESEYKGMCSVVGETSELRVEIVPGRGGKLVSFISKSSGKEWAFQTEVPWKPLTYGMMWDEGDRSGWDEMFPTILACPCPDHPWRGTEYPDHGEVWTLPWDFELHKDRLRMWVHGVKVPYQFAKTYTISGGTLYTTYEVHNPTPYPFSYLWCAHNLLAVSPGMQLLVPDNLDTVQYQYSHQNRLTERAYGRSSFPFVNGTAVNLSVIEPNLGEHAEKYWFEGDLTDGHTGIFDPASGETLGYSFSPEDVPYLAVWANYGAFNGDYTFALEPATGYLDDVYIASVMNKVKSVPAMSQTKWTFDISITKERTSHEI